MGKARREQLRKAIVDKQRPRCNVPGCVFRLPVCPVHDVDHGGDYEHDALEHEISSNGRTGGRR